MGKEPCIGLVRIGYQKVSEVVCTYAKLYGQKRGICISYQVVREQTASIAHFQV